MTNAFVGHIFMVLLRGGGHLLRAGVGVIYPEGVGRGLLIPGIRGGISQLPLSLLFGGWKGVLAGLMKEFEGFEHRKADHGQDMGTGYLVDSTSQQVGPGIC